MSARNYQKGAAVGIGDYIEKHPLTDLLREQTWNNIPIPIRQMFELVCDALIGQDIHTWERKSLINERFFKMQHLASRLNERIVLVKQEMTRWIEDVMKRTFDHSRRIGKETNDRMIGVEKHMESENVAMDRKIEQIEAHSEKVRRDLQDIANKLKKDMSALSRETQSALKEQGESLLKNVDTLNGKLTVFIDASDPELNPVHQDSFRIGLGSQKSFTSPAANRFSKGSNDTRNNSYEECNTPKLRASQFSKQVKPGLNKKTTPNRAVPYNKIAIANATPTPVDLLEWTTSMFSRQRTLTGDKHSKIDASLKNMYKDIMKKIDD